MSNEHAAGIYRLSNRLSLLKPSATIGLIGKVNQMRAEGISVISFAQGEPDFPTPELVKQAGIQAIEQNHTRYTPEGGTLELRRAVAQRVEQDNGIAYTPNQISTTTGAKEALYLALQAICDEGDEVIIPAPYWVSYLEQVHLTGATPVIVNTNTATHFKMTAEQLAAHLSPRTRVVILNSPSNPTGAVYNAQELRALADVLQNSNALILSDEIYDVICYVAYARWLRVAPEFAHRTLIVNGTSKTYSMTGWRAGYIAGPEPIIKAIKSIQSHSTTHTASLTQYAMLTAYTPSPELDKIVTERVEAFRERRDVIVEALAKIPGVICPIPDGAFYVFPDVSGLLNRPLSDGTICATSEELANYLLEKAHIAVVFGEAFGMPGCLRLSYAQDSKTLLEGIHRFATAVGN